MCVCVLFCGGSVLFVVSVPERSKGVDSSSTVFALVGSNPTADMCTCFRGVVSRRFALELMGLFAMLLCLAIMHQLIDHRFYTYANSVFACSASAHAACQLNHPLAHVAVSSYGPHTRTRMELELSIVPGMMFNIATQVL